jgi:hypothetical protein
MSTKAISNLILLVFTLIFSASLGAQEENALTSINNEALLEILDIEQISLEQLVEVIGYRNEGSSNQDGYALKKDLAFFLVSMDSRLIQSLSFRLFRGRDAAFRDLQYLEFFPKEYRGNDPLSGSDLVSLLSRYAEWSRLQESLGGDQ